MERRMLAGTVPKPRPNVLQSVQRKQLEPDLTALIRLSCQHLSQDNVVEPARPLADCAHLRGVAQLDLGSEMQLVERDRIEASRHCCLTNTTQPAARCRRRRP